MLTVSQAEQQGMELEEVFNTDGPAMDNFAWCTFHSDGITSTVYKARDRTDGSVVALKVMKTDSMQPPHEGRKELRILQKVLAESGVNSSIVQLLRSFHQPGGFLVLVFPFLRQDLENLLRSGRLSKKQSGMVYHGLFSALTWLHERDIIHRDIKPGNILLKEMEGPVYLIDFGITWAPDDADSEPADHKITDVGTTCYRPPELLFGYRQYDTSLDMWAAGCVVAEVLRKGHHSLFDAGPAGTELGLIKSMFETLGTPTNETWPSASNYPDWGKFTFQQFPGKAWEELLDGASEASVDFVNRTVCFETTRRMTATQALKHPLCKELAIA